MPPKKDKKETDKNIRKVMTTSIVNDNTIKCTARSYETDKEKIADINVDFDAHMLYDKLRPKTEHYPIFKSLTVFHNYKDHYILGGLCKSVMTENPYSFDELKKNYIPIYNFAIYRSSAILSGNIFNIVIYLERDSELPEFENCGKLIDYYNGRMVSGKFKSRIFCGDKKFLDKCEDIVTQNIVKELGCDNKYDLPNEKLDYIASYINKFSELMDPQSFYQDKVPTIKQVVNYFYDKYMNETLYEMLKMFLVILDKEKDGNNSIPNKNYTNFKEIMEQAKQTPEFANFVETIKQEKEKVAKIE